jgi:hypothetical protein
MKNWNRLTTSASLCMLLLPAAMAVAQAYPQTRSTNRDWKSSNGRHAIRVEETVSTVGVGRLGPDPAFLRRTLDTTRVTGIAISPDGAPSVQWQWTRAGFRVAGALVGDAGNLSVLVKAHVGTEPTSGSSRSANLAVPLEVVLLDGKGTQHAAVRMEDWQKALGADGNVSPDSPPALRFLENEKILEIKLASGKTARVNTDTGELSVENDAATAPATVPAASHAAPAAPASRDGAPATPHNGP